MASITINGVNTQLVPLTYGQVKANRGAVDILSTDAADVFERTERAIAFLALTGVPVEDLETVPPGALLKASVALFSETFRPEDPAQVAPQNP